MEAELERRGETSATAAQVATLDQPTEDTSNVLEKILLEGRELARPHLGLQRERRRAAGLAQAFSREKAEVDACGDAGGLDDVPATDEALIHCGGSEVQGAPPPG